MYTVLNILSMIVLTAELDEYLDLLLSLLYVIGVWAMLRKSGIKGWWALVPGASEYQLSRCAGRESEGKVFFCVRILMTAAQIAGSLIPESLYEADRVSTLMILLVILSLTLGLIYLIYSIRIWIGLIEVYNQKKGWLFFILISPLHCVPALFWGFSPKYQPSWKVEDFRENLRNVVSHGSATVLSEGLTVDLKKRTTRDFLTTKILLQDIHLSIPAGHMVLLLGGSGAGKTTFVNAVNGYEKADAKVLLNEVDLYKNYSKMQYDIGFVPQGEMMREKDTVLRTLMDASKLRMPLGVTSAQRRARVDEVMEIFGLTSLKNDLVEKLSGGQKKRLSISIEFLSNPSLFILDEPDSGLDGVIARELFEQLRKIADTGKIVIVITHTPDRVIDLFDDVIVLAKDQNHVGRLAFYGSTEEARKFFDRDSMEQIVKSVNRPEEGGDGRADELIAKYAEVQHV